MSIGKNIKYLRESHGLTQVELGDIAGTTDKAVSSWENDSRMPRMGAIEKLSQYFNVSKSAILDDDPTTVKKLTAANRDSELSAKKQALIERIKSLSDADIDFLQAAADALIARRQG